MNISISPDKIITSVDYFTSTLSSTQAGSLGSSFVSVVRSIIHSIDGPIASLPIVSPSDLGLMLSRQTIPSAVESCIHWQIQQQIETRPNDIAVSSWEGDLTYADLGAQATRLAAHLRNLGAGPEAVAALCFHKSAFAATSMVAVLMSGAAFVPIDPGAPSTRLRGILSDSKASLILACTSTSGVVSDLDLPVVVVGSPLINSIPFPSPSPTPPSVVPRNTAVILFTSGSTGKPKGIVMPHSSLSCTAAAYGSALNINPGVRLLNFSAYTFDIGVLDIVVTLARGATVCIPSETSRVDDLAGVIDTFRAEWVLLTPTVANLLTPASVPTLKLLVLGGEAIPKRLVEKWRGKVDLHIIYGPAEASTCGWNPEIGKSPNMKSTNIGYPLASAFWVVNPDNHRQLVPAGVVGELLVQGPMLARGYVTNDSKANANWVDNADFVPGKKGRAYLSGDLVRLNDDGTYTFVGRKDTQVKLHGQRIELGEVEAHIQECLPEQMTAVLDVTATSVGEKVLTAFLWYTTASSASREGDLKIVDNPSHAQRKVIADLRSNLRQRLPAYMVPAVFLLLSGQPKKTVSGKVDRKQFAPLARIEPNIRTGHNVIAEADQPRTETEFRLRKHWAAVLSVEAEQVGRHDSFLEIGGDSIGAIKVVMAARDAGMRLSVQDIFANPQLEALAAKIADTGDAGDEEEEEAYGTSEPFGLLPPAQLAAVKSAVAQQCALDSSECIQDAYPCTPFQAGLLSLAVKQPGSYIARHVYQLADHVHVGRFRKAWEATVSACDNLRTRIILHEGLSLQAVIREAAEWEHQPAAGLLDLAAALAAAEKMEMQYGSRLARYALVSEPSGARYFVLCIHHAAFDGWSMGLMLDTLRSVYSGALVPDLEPFVAFADYATRVKDESEDFWRSHLAGAQKTLFLSAKPERKTTTPSTQVLETKVAFRRQAGGGGFTSATVLRAAWALVLSRYSDSDDVCFGAAVSGRQAPVPGVERMPGPAVATVPVRVSLADRSQSVASFLASVQCHSAAMIPHEQLGLQHIARLSPDAQEACDFATLMVVQPGQLVSDMTGNNELFLSSGLDAYRAKGSLDGYFSYPLVIQVVTHDDKDEVDLLLMYDPTVVAESQSTALGKHLEHVIKQLLSKPDASIADVSVSCAWDLEQSIAYNGQPPNVITTCVHGLIEAQAAIRPAAMAIRAWDLNLTYSELNAAANRLAHHLTTSIDAPVRLGDLVHVCFEKSAWFFVAALAINKAGGAWVPLDPSHPHQRQQTIVRQTGAALVLCSPEQEAKMSPLLPHVVVVSPDLDSRLVSTLGTDPPNTALGVTPSHAVYVLFTSGSTGVPKGLVMTHGAVATSQTAIAARLGLTPDVKLLQFASFVFDLCIGEIVAPLITGAQICVPSEATRLSGIEGFINDMGVSWAFLTPAFARTIQPADVPNLELLLLAGEAVGRDVFDQWFGRVRFVNGWGPAETCVFSTLHEWKDAGESPMTVGRPVGGFCWIVDAEDPSRLAPVSCTGEVVIQGPTILREYLADPARTRSSTVTDLPAWAPRRNEWSRFFRSGDLCFYNSRGEIQFVARKDTQAKIRGLRVELGEVEHHSQGAIERVQQVVVEVLRDGDTATLAAFICFSNDTRVISGYEAEDVFLPPDGELKSRLIGAVAQLTVLLPTYMVPSIFIPCRYIPFIGSTKIDRGGLRRLAASLPREKLVAEYGLSETDKRPVSSPDEHRMQAVWAAILKIPADGIGRDDSFLRLGGDSISAIQLVAAARAAAFNLSVHDIFADPRLSAVTAKGVLKSAGGWELREVEPFGLVPAVEADNLKAAVARECAVLDSEIEDLYPATSLQEGLMALAVKQPGSYIARLTYKLSDGVDIARFRAAWATTLEACDNLRTRIIANNDGQTYQAIIKESPSWEDIPDKENRLSSMLSSIKRAEMTYGSRLCRYALVSTADSDTPYFILVLHHAIFDGWTMGLVLDTLRKAYTAANLPVLEPYSRFISYTARLDQELAAGYWAAQLAGSQKASFPQGNAVSRPDAKPSTHLLETSIPCPRPTDASITRATVLRAAWAIVLARYCDTLDVTFGIAVSGRQASVPGLSKMPGLVVATVPTRVVLSDRSQLVSDFLRGIQAQASEMVPFEQYGLQNISKLSAAAKDACDFSSLLVIQPADMWADVTGGTELVTAEETSRAEQRAGYFNYPLILEAIPYDDRIDLTMVYDAGVVSVARLEALTQHLQHVVRQLLQRPEALLGSVSVAGPWDRQQAVANNHNGIGPEIVNGCVHTAFEASAARRPDHLAVRAWDGGFTYSQLNAAANRLATHLVRDHGVSVGDLVPVLYEKSAWYLVSIVAVNKAGAVWVPLEPSHPAARRKQIVSQTNARLAISSPGEAAACAELVPCVVVVSQELDAVLASLSSPDLISVPVTPSHAAYVLFTSGSTGVPKGLVMTHRAVMTSQTELIRCTSFGPDDVVLQFASHVFDLAIAEIVPALIAGATIAVPHQDSRLNGIEAFARDFNVTWAFPTPAFIRTLNPSSMPQLKTVVMGGEAVGQDILDVWLGPDTPPGFRLFNSWGPAETCVASSLHLFTSARECPLTVGAPLAGFCWIVEPDDPTRLAPIGCVGELMIQGPTLLREYLADEAKTAAATVASLPDWTTRTDPPFDRFFKSGDLAVYNSQGEIDFVSRKDTQVKIRGLRVELGEVEHHLLVATPGMKRVVVDVLRDNGTARLVAFLSENEKSAVVSAHEVFRPLTKELKERIVAAVGQLNVILPDYMIPVLFIPVDLMPSITSSKIDRKGLRAAAQALPRHVLAAYTLTDGDKRAMESDEERQMQHVWAKVLSIPAEAIGRDDSFLRLGGDSISAIQLVTAFREHPAFSLTVRDIFADPRLWVTTAKALQNSRESDEEDAIRPFTLLSPEKVEHILAAVVEHCALHSPDDIEDAYPCTPLQEGLMALAVKQPGSYVARRVYQLPDDVDLDSFRHAWEGALDACTNLRTRFVVHDGTSVQAVVRESPAWEPTPSGTGSLRLCLEQAKAIPMQYGSRLCRYSLVMEDGRPHFVLIIHHAIFDGWALELVMQRLRNLYHGLSVPALEPYARFVRHAAHIDAEAAAAYWTQQLEGTQRASFPSTDLAASPVPLTRVSKSSIAFRQPSESKATEITTATLIRAAWAIVLARYSDCIGDVCFGTTVSGRHAPVSGVSHMAGPALATVPVRVRLDGTQQVSSFLHDVQTQAAEMAAFEQFGLQNISRLNSHAKCACDFASLMVVQPAQAITSPETGLLVPVDVGPAEEAVGAYFSYPLVFEAVTDRDRVHLVTTYDANVVSSDRVKALTVHFEHVLGQLLDGSVSGSTATLADVSVAGHWDLDKAVGWNNHVQVEFVDACVHDLIAATPVSDQPDRQAVYAWDGTLTYRQLCRESDNLAAHLSSLGVGADMLVPVCFEKSRYAIVAMLGILKAGGAFVPLDPAHPEARRRQLVAEAKARVMVASAATIQCCVGLTDVLVEVSAASLASLASTAASSLHQSRPPQRSASASPSSAAYAIFTSGSTGRPKTILVPHSALSTSTVAQRAAFSMDSSSRVLQFSNFVFDASIAEIFTTLVTGGTICIPSDADRLSNLAGFISQAQVSNAHLTPSFIETLRPADVPSLRTIVLGGEAPTKNILRNWVGKVRLINGYGPTETVIYCASFAYASANDEPATIGRGLDAKCWVVDDVTDRTGTFGRARNGKARLTLTPTGCVGELVVQGNALARGYANDEELTRRSFLDAAEFLPPASVKDHRAKSERLYRTGDLVRYNFDGTLHYLGRRDTQTKLRGQRIELGAVEAAVKQCNPAIEHVAVDVLKHIDNREWLVAVVTLDAYADDEDGAALVALSPRLRDMFCAVQRELQGQLPAYMVPSFLLPLRSMPFQSSMKLDRAELRETTASLSHEDLLKYSLADGQKAAPTTDTEIKMRHIWARVLRLDPQQIGRDDSFLLIGGDSITAIHVVTEAREVYKLKLTVQHIFADPRLWAVSLKAADADDAFDVVDRFLFSPRMMWTLHALRLRPSASSRPDWRLKTHTPAPRCRKA